jgi:hypothetical protein
MVDGFKEDCFSDNQVATPVSLGKLERVTPNCFPYVGISSPYVFLFALLALSALFLSL